MSASVTQTRRIAVARPVSGSTSTIVPQSRTSPVATSNSVGMPGERGFQHAVDAAADDALERAGHADVALKRGAAGEDALVGRRHVRVRAEHRRDAAVEIAAHELHFAGGFGVEIDEPDAHVAGHLAEHAVGGMPGAVDRLHEQLAEQARDADAFAVAGRDDRPIAADRFGRQVGRLDDVRLAFEDGVDLAAAIDVIAERDGVDPGADQLAVDRRREPRAAGGVLGVGDRPGRVVSSRTRPGIACSTISRPGLPTMSPMKRIRTG